MGTIAAAAHANGDTINENIRPEDDYNVEQGFDIYHRSNFMRIGALSSSVSLSNEQVVEDGSYDTRRPAQRDDRPARARGLGE